MGSSIGRAAPCCGVCQRFEFSPINYQVRIWLDEDAVLKTVGRDERLGGSSPSRIAKENNMRKDKRFKTANPIYLYSDISAQYDLLLKEYNELGHNYIEVSQDYIKLANCYKELKKENTELKEEISEWKKVSECDTPFQLNHLLTEINKKLQRLNQELRKLFC